MLFSEPIKWYKLPGRLLSCFSLLGTVVISSCQQSPEIGYLKVNAPSDGTYEIYRIASEWPLQLVSEELGRYNQRQPLDAGTYLVLADCSSESVVVLPNTEHSLTAHSLTFETPSEPRPKDTFSIQCTQHIKTQTRQKLQNQFSIQVLRGTHKILVGMMPLAIEAKELEPQKFRFRLSSFVVNKPATEDPQTRYFLSPTNQTISVTESQSLGSRQFLLPGDYWVELNGTRTRVKLAEGQESEINPGFLLVSTSKQVDLSLSSKIKGGPLYVEINGDHWLNLNETFIVMPGSAALRLVGSEKQHRIDIVSDELVQKNVRSVRVDLDCPPWDWACLGSKRVFLFEKGQHYPFAAGVSDVPLLFFEEDAWLSIASSRSIHYHISAHRRDSILKTGQIELQPRLEHRTGSVTDLARIETIQLPYQGHSLDIQLDRKSRMTLIAGSYYLAQYHSFAGSEGERRRNRRRIYVAPNTSNKVYFTVHQNEKKVAQYQLRAKKRQALRRKARRKRLLQDHSARRPLGSR